MEVEELVEYFNNHPSSLTSGGKSVAKNTHSALEDVLAARAIIRSQQGKRTYNKYNIKSSNDVKIEQTIKVAKTPKILIFDIETAPMIGYIWGLWKQNVHIDQVINDWFVICWSAKWLYSGEVLGDTLTPEEALNKDDSRIVTSLWQLFDEADIVVAHNGDRFDIPKMNSRFIINGLMPPSSYKSVDTCLVARKNFGFASNKLDALATYFGFDHKLDTDFSLWEGCLKGDKESLDYMLEYNKRDVTLLEEVYIKLLPWIKNHPNVANYLNTEIPVCSKCGDDSLVELEGKFYYTQVGKYQLYRCSNCGTIVRGRKNLNRTNKVKAISPAY